VKPLGRPGQRGSAPDASPRSPRRSARETTERALSRAACNARSHPFAWGPAAADLLLHRALPPQCDDRGRPLAGRYCYTRLVPQGRLHQMWHDRRGRAAGLERTIGARKSDRRSMALTAPTPLRTGSRLFGRVSPLATATASFDCAPASDIETPSSPTRKGLFGKSSMIRSSSSGWCTGRHRREEVLPGRPIESAPAVSPPIAESRPITSLLAIPRSCPRVRSCSLSCRQFCCPRQESLGRNALRFFLESLSRSERRLSIQSSQDHR
jgi:hypothetical protein